MCHKKNIYKRGHPNDGEMTPSEGSNELNFLRQEHKDLIPESAVQTSLYSSHDTLLWLHSRVAPPTDTV